jgi:hypothetical protein
MIIQGKEIDLKEFRKQHSFDPVGTEADSYRILDALESILNYADIPLTMSCFVNREDLEKHRYFAERVRKCVEEVE